MSRAGSRRWDPRVVDLAEEVSARVGGDRRSEVAPEDLALARGAGAHNQHRLAEHVSRRECVADLARRDLDRHADRAAVPLGASRSRSRAIEPLLGRGQQSPRRDQRLESRSGPENRLRSPR